MSHRSYNNSDPDFPSANDGETHIFSCDEDRCKETFEAEGDFSSIWASAKREGWRCFKNPSGDWEHRCPNH